jgi:hypothetical protein
MYENTGVAFISKQLLGLPKDMNTPDNSLSWGSFISKMNLGIDLSKDALENVSYRLDSYSGIKFNIYEHNDDEKSYQLADNKDNMLNICDFFYHIENEDGSILPYNSITSINSLNFGDQYIDFRGMFNLFPNVNDISNFLNGKLQKYNIDGLLKPCKNIKSIINSFCDNDVDNNVENPQIIDLYNFFNWDENTTVGVTNLFEGQSNNNFANGFKVRKTITYSNFKKVLEKIAEIAEKNEEFKRLTNIFSYCTITEYNNEEIKFEKSLNNVKNISFLFEKCTSDYKPFVNANAGEKGIYTGGVLNIGRSFFEKLPEFNIAQRTFANTYLSSSLTYDYFCKRDKEYKETDVYLSENQSDIAKLYECSYSSNIINLKECFYNTKFVNCKNWFDENDNVSIDRNYIMSGENIQNSRGIEYYKYNIISGSYEKYVLDNDIIDDCLDNYTDYIPDNEIYPYMVYNHDLLQDFYYYGNIKDAKIPFDPENKSRNNTIQKTYCCIPPDFLYGCSSTASIDSIFANSNIIGVIPRNLTKKIKSQSIPNIFKNVNIMPNIEYYYDENGSLDNSILNNINDIVEIEGGIGDNYCVVFRDENGVLKKRKPVVGDRNLGQFVYVPANFTTSVNLMETFNFRYNLPKKWDMPLKTNVDGYKSTKEFNNAIKNSDLNLDYHTQYYFTTDRSVQWNNVRDVKYLFITNGQDIDFSNIKAIGNARDYCNFDGETDFKYKNAWTVDYKLSSATEWNNSGIIENFYIDLNLCGKKNQYNMIEDNGCPIVIKDREVKLDNFISGIITTFLNGRVFDEKFAVNDLKSSSHKNNGSAYVIDYQGFGKNMILPKYSGSPSDNKFIFIPIDGSNVIYYDFMINDNEEQSKTNYKNYFGDKLNINTTKNKYTLK